MMTTAVEIYANPNLQGTNWGAYIGSNRLLPKASIEAIASEAALLCSKQRLRPAPYCSSYNFKELNDDTRFDQDLDNYVTYEFALEPDDVHDAYMDTSVLKQIPAILAFRGLLQSLTGQKKSWFLINDIPDGGLIARHQDVINDSVVALNLVGKGRVSIVDAPRIRRRFRTEPGDAFVIHNNVSAQARPLHRVIAKGGPRMSIVI